MSLEWQEWTPPAPVELHSPQMVWLNETVFACNDLSLSRSGKLFSVRPGIDSEWSAMITPSHSSGLVVHDSQLLLVGGFIGGSRTKQIFTLKDKKFFEELPPMIESVVSPAVVSYRSMLFVAVCCCK